MLAGLRILDFTRLLPGPFATQILADLGAEVIKIEEPTLGDYIRKNVQSTVDGNSIAFHAINRGKKSVSLNLKLQRDRDVLQKLIATADILIESFRPGVMAKLGMDPKALLKQFPSLIVCSISGYGQNGPYRLRAGHDINYLANAGLLGLSKTPSVPPAQIADLAGGALPAVMQIMAALYHREKNGGKGNIIDVSMTDCSYAFAVLPHSIAKNTDSELSNGKYVLNGGVPCYQVYPCKDGWISVGALEPKFWRVFCVHILNAKHLLSKALSVGHRCEAVKHQITEILMSKTCAEWRPIIAQNDCCVEIIPSLEEAGKSALIQARDLDIDIEIRNEKKKKTQTITVAKSPLNMMHGIDFQRKPGPTKIGQHNDEILSKL